LIERRDDERGRAGTFFTLNAVLLYAGFTRTQAFGWHHYLPLGLWLLVLLCAGVASVVFRLRMAVWRAATIAYLSAAIIFASVLGGVPRAVDTALA
jgi:hypothetical protein